jgi:hypothetical protein
MEFFNILKKICEKLNITAFNKNITINNIIIGKGDFNTKQKIHIKNKEVYIELENFTKKEIEKIKPQIIELYNNTKKITSLDFKKQLDLFKNYNITSDYKKDEQILIFFKKIISEDDFLALETSLYLRYLFTKKEFTSVKKIKKDIIYKFGDRGKNICNLCSAGYFDRLLKEIYNSDKTKDKKEFKKIYELIITNIILAIFVNSTMEFNQIDLEITNKIYANKKYGINDLYIHGLGFKNIKNIKNWINKNKQNITIKEIYENKEKHILIAKLIF